MANFIIVLNSVCSCGVDTHVYQTDALSEAKEILELGYADAHDEFDPETSTFEKTSRSYRVWKTGNNFNDNNMTGQIYDMRPTLLPECYRQNSSHIEF